jgi:magnesium transporter
MIRTFADNPKLNFKWIDVLGPSPEELQEVANKYGIHEAFVADVLQPEHLPKYEPVGKTSFFILRYYSAKDNTDVDTIQGLTNKIAIFQADELVITIHRLEIDFINDLKKNLIDTGECKGTFHLLNRVIKSVFQSYEVPAHKLAQEIDFYESQTFLKKNPPPILRGLYHVKRQIEVSRRLLILSKDILEQIDDPEHQDPNSRDTRDLYIRMLTLFDTMSENTNHLLTLYFSISAQRTNEVIRVLTIFSVFFMPLTFIVGIYGMNFDFMPELRWKVGYPAVMLVMVVVTISIYTWFRRKHWL